jgi:methylmalonyl-CoA mutase N-terminal domain/subunit
MDEAWALPSEQAALLALRTQQIIAEESGVADTVDPLGGSYYLETLTRQVEEAAYDYFRRIEDMGGVIPAIESGYLQREIADASYAQQREFDGGEQLVVGMNAYTNGGEVGIPLLKVDMEGECRQVRRLEEVRRSRDNRQVASTLQQLEAATGRSENLMPPIIEAVRAYATLGEIMGVLRNRFGEYVPTWGI